jgi:endonuclease YncB( thermonuclease family)
MAAPRVTFSYTRNIRPAYGSRFMRVSDGDTPAVEQPIRMVSCDTPEKSGYAGKPETAQRTLNTCRTRLEGSFYRQLPRALRDHLLEHLDDDAAERHIEAGNIATGILDGLMDVRLTRADGKKRRLAVIATGEVVDRYGRLLAYIAPYFGGGPGDPLPARGAPERRTFNLDMIENGWAAFFPIYPSLPRDPDLNMALQAAHDAWFDRRGMWAAFGSWVLLAYEYRACVKLARARTAAEGMAVAFQRHCVDIRDRRLLGRFDYHTIEPCYRLWVWPDDLARARADLRLR